MAKDFIRSFYLLGSLLCMLASNGCVRRASPPPASLTDIPSQEIRLHQVNYPNENLSIIALWYTGDAKNWRLLKTFNGHLKSVSLLSTGDVIRIPADLMVRFDPMTVEFVNQQKAKFKAIRRLSLPSSTSSRLPPQPTASATESPQDTVESEEFLDDSVDDLVPQSPTPDAPQDQLIENLLHD